MLLWRDEYLIGVEELDYEHRDLFQQLNKLHRELRSHREKAGVLDCLGDIHLRLQAHFALEEQYMRANDYAGYGDHKRVHDEFLDTVIEFIDGVRGRASIAPDFYGAIETKLRAWIVDHILVYDRKLSRRCRT